MTYPKCLNHPKRIGNRRGLCNECYKGMLKRIKEGAIKEKLAISQGLLLPKAKAGRRRSIKPFPQTR